MFRLMRLGCLAYSLVMLIPVLLLAGGALVLGDTLGLLPAPVAGPVESAERMVATQFIGGDLASAHFQLRSLDVSPSGAGDGKFVLTAAIESQNPLPKNPGPSALPAIKALGTHLGQPFGLGAAIERIVISLYGPGGTVPVLSATIATADLSAWQNSTISDATFLGRWTDTPGASASPSAVPASPPVPKSSTPPKASPKASAKPKASPSATPAG
jgi:hypothetical protein